MSNCRNNRCYEQRRARPGSGFGAGPYNRRRNYNRYDRSNRSDVMGDRRIPPGGEPCPYRTPRAWQNSRYNRLCR